MLFIFLYNKNEIFVKLVNIYLTKEFVSIRIPGNRFVFVKAGLVAVTSQLRWRTEASGWAASAACLHHLSPEWNTLEDFSPSGLHTWDEDSTLHARTWTKDESVHDDGRAS
jgi:hypothetical protein